MPPRILYDIDQLDFAKPQYTLEDIRNTIPQRYEFEQLTAIVKLFPEDHLVVGYKDVCEDEFWVRGHVPGRPVLPGVLMIEAAAQLCTFHQMNFFGSSRFFAFGGADKVKFRGSVLPGARLILLSKGIRLHPHRSVFYNQGVVEGKLVFECEILGIQADPLDE